MIYFENLSNHKREELFYSSPNHFSTSDAELLPHGLGAVLYVPGDRKKLSSAIRSTEASTIVICLEDAVSDVSLDFAHQNIKKALLELYGDYKKEEILPFIFIRCRNQEHFEYIESILTPVQEILTGFTIPKFESESGRNTLAYFAELEEKWQRPIYLMPILESGPIVHLESRSQELEALLALFLQYKERIINLRIGATDISGLYGLRRPRNATIWDSVVLFSFLSDLINTFSRQEHDFILSGPVWEYFERGETDQTGGFISPEIRGLIQEVEKDHLNGLWGKTVIHPSQITPVLSRMVVPYHDYKDALSIVQQSGGVSVSSSGQRMNEQKPHTYWAKKILKRAHIFGVYNENIEPNMLLESYTKREITNTISLEYHLN